MTKIKKTSTFALRADTKRKWLKALRSGKYKQTRGSLYDDIDGGYCCLGVMCKVIDGASDAAIVERSMPGEVLPKYEDISFSVIYNGKLSPLDEINDRAGLSFKCIANVIERTVPTFTTDPSKLKWPTNNKKKKEK